MNHGRRRNGIAGSRHCQRQPGSDIPVDPAQSAHRAIRLQSEDQPRPATTYPGRNAGTDLFARICRTCAQLWQLVAEQPLRVAVIHTDSGRRRFGFGLGSAQSGRGADQCRQLELLDQSAAPAGRDDPAVQPAVQRFRQQVPDRRIHLRFRIVRQRWHGPRLFHVMGRPARRQRSAGARAGLVHQPAASGRTEFHQSRTARMPPPRSRPTSATSSMSAARAAH